VRKVLGWWLSGGVYGTLVLAMTSNLPFMATTLTGAMQAVADMPQWAETADALLAGQGPYLRYVAQAGPQILEYANDAEPSMSCGPGSRAGATVPEW
jgi:hypothetical protein